MKTRKPEKRFFPVKDGVKCLCPYCRGTFVWPPAEMRCPVCGKTVRPPPGYAPSGKEERREIVEKIRNNYERKRGEIGKVPNFKPSRDPAMFFGILAAFAVICGAVGVMSVQKKDAPRAKSDPLAETRKDMRFYATALEHYKLDVGNYPTANKDGGLRALVEDPGEPDWAGPYAPIIRRDWWKRGYFYDCTNGVPVLMSSGPDKLFGTSDDLLAAPELFKPHGGFVANDPVRMKNRPPAPVRLNAD